MNNTYQNKICKDIRELASRIGRKLIDLHCQARANKDLRRIIICCLALLAMLMAFNPFLGLLFLLGACLIIVD
ncbi:MAG: hypothetical protein WC299_05630 [Kiritimatiellia bacterium]